MGGNLLLFKVTEHPKWSENSMFLHAQKVYSLICKIIFKIGRVIKDDVFQILFLAGEFPVNDNLLSNLMYQMSLPHIPHG
jgi:hypothetical protein